MAKGRIVYSTDPEPEPQRPRRPGRRVPPGEQTIYVSRDRKGRGGKTVTVMEGFQEDENSLKTLLKALKGLCGAGGTVRAGALEVQGDHRDKLLAHLQTLGYRTKQKGG